MKILIIGADGMLGSDLVKVLSKNHEVIESLEKNLDIADKQSVEKFVLSNKPSLVINAAGYTDVDSAESNRGKAFAINAEGPLNIALACKKSGSRLLHFSTDYIFDGTKDGPYTEEDEPNPINVYGASKLKGEQNIQSAFSDYIIVRTQWLYGKNGKNFVDAILKLMREKSEVKVVNDQVGSPTYTLDLAKATKTTIEKNIPSGIYNVANRGYCSWFEFAVEIAKLKNIRNVKIIPVASEEFPRPAKRPKNTRLKQGRFREIIGYLLRNWEDALTEYLS